MAEKGRSPKGSAHWTKRMPEKILRGEQRPQATVNESIVREIRKMGAIGTTRKSISESTGVSIRNVGRIITRERWAHIP